jgi:putative transposase
MVQCAWASSGGRNAAEFTQPLLALGVKLSMDGKGRCLENVFVEWLWRTVKYDEIYLKSYQSQIEAHTNLDNFFRFYNDQRPHGIRRAAPGRRTPPIGVSDRPPATRHRWFRSAR